MELTARQNFELLKTRVLEAWKHRDTAVHHQLLQDEEEGRQQYEMKQYKRKKKHREMDLERDRHHCRSGKEHQAQAQAAKTKADELPSRVPPKEKTLTIKMPNTGRPIRTKTPAMPNALTGRDLIPRRAYPTI